MQEVGCFHEDKLSRREQACACVSVFLNSLGYRPLARSTITSRAKFHDYLHSRSRYILLHTSTPIQISHDTLELSLLFEIGTLIRICIVFKSR